MRLSAHINFHAARTVLFIGATGFLLLAVQEEPMSIETETHRTEKQQNRLITEKSPYLFQHADNPVNWYPWGDEAFEKARKEDKPIFLSIGYSTCHWCHVMAHESFESLEVADLMNDVFVSIKVDREERPDIDSVYMTVCQMMTGSGGWPLTIIMTPDKKPFYAATYIPKNTRHGRIGMIELIPRINEYWSLRREELERVTEDIQEALQKVSAASSGALPDESTMKQAYEQLSTRFDTRNGGFGSAPKFPTPHTLYFLLRHWKRTGDEHSLEMVEKTLETMRRGGIYDHIGYGFHRYSTDAEWLVPHFEKMLYDQALLALAYTEGYLATGHEEYARTAREIFDYVLRDMTSPEGGFYTAEDADSEGEEGKFYVWDYEEIRQLLTPDELQVVVNVFTIKKDGNYLDEASRKKTNTNILHLTKPLKHHAADMNITEQELSTRIETIRQKLFHNRENRIHPGKDDKILTDWNGLMIAALAYGSRAFDIPSYAEAAQRAADFTLNNLRTHDGRLLHRYKDGEAAISAHLDDYAFLIWGLIELYETTYDLNYLNHALALNNDMTKHFLDKENGGFYFTADDSEKLLIRQKQSYDGALPSGNSVAMLNLLRLGRLTYSSDLEDKAVEIGRHFSRNIMQSPTAFTFLMVAVDFLTGPSYEVVIAGNPQADDTKEMIRTLQRQFIPNTVVLFKNPEQEPSAHDPLAGLTMHYTSEEGKATAYVCQNFVCKLPTTDNGTMLELLNAIEK
ncbi:thioredoxin domain-containing protein [Candidatus Omnitrophota bacterium]